MRETNRLGNSARRNPQRMRNVVQGVMELLGWVGMGWVGVGEENVRRCALGLTSGCGYVQ